jgi:hypothetical protein
VDQEQADGERRHFSGPGCGGAPNGAAATRHSRAG